MDNSRFSSLIYRIIGKPDRWHDDYIDVMHQILDETDSFDDPYNFTELALGDRIITELKENSEALTAFNILLDRSRFKMIILDEHLKPIYYNKNAERLYDHVLDRLDKQKLNPGLANQIRQRPLASANNQHNPLAALDFYDQNGGQLYLRSIQSRVDSHNNAIALHILMALDPNQQNNSLNADLVAKYELTEKEQMVVRGLIHGKPIRQIAVDSFISENTVKTHLKAIFRKTGTNSQSAVVGLILTHEAQIIDSYFESDLPAIAAQETKDIDKTVTLRDGTKIVYRDYGPSQGRPIIVFHSGYGCRLSIPPKHREICQRTNRRIIIPDRPGIGKTPYVQDHPRGWNQRLLEFIDMLGIQEYEVLGNIFGAQLAVDYAAQADERLKKVILCSPVVINHQAMTDHLTGILNPTARLVKASTRFAREIYELWLKSVNLNLGKHYRNMLRDSIGTAELEQFLQDGTFELLIETFQEGASQSLDGISNEMIKCLSPLKIPAEKLNFDTEFWYGDEDNRISLQGVKTLVQEFSNHRLHVRQGYSEHIYYSLFEEIIA